MSVAFETLRLRRESSPAEKMEVVTSMYSEGWISAEEARGLLDGPIHEVAVRRVPEWLRRWRAWWRR